MSSNVHSSGTSLTLRWTTLHHFTQQAPETLLPPAWEQPQLEVPLKMFLVVHCELLWITSRDIWKENHGSDKSQIMKQGSKWNQEGSADPNPG